MNLILDVTGVFFLKIFSSVFRTIPHKPAIRVGYVLGSVLFFFSKRKRVAYADIKAGLGSRFSEAERWKIIRRHYRLLGRMFVEVLRFPLLDPEELGKKVKLCHPERYEQVAKENKGFIYITGHFGNWELSQIYSARVLKRPVHVLAREQRHARLNQALNELREVYGSVTISKGMGVRGLLRALRSRQTVGVLGDQDAGRDGGAIFRFLGRKTTVPTGAFELARKTGVPILPSFAIWREGGEYEIHFEEIIRVEQEGDPKETVHKAVEKYLRLLEIKIQEYPDHWLWESKRWKYTWTRRIVILSDGKAGHYKQAQAIASHLKGFDTYHGREGLEWRVDRIEVRYRSKWRRLLFDLCALFVIPFAQGKLARLGFFFDDETLKQLENVSCDFVISAGSGLIPLNLYLAKDSRAKSIVLMRPGFPYNLCRYDLAIVPAHDSGRIPKHHFKTVLTPNENRKAEMKRAGEKIADVVRERKRVKLSIFIGGPTRDFKLDLSHMERFFSGLKKAAPQIGDYLVTTSRRTPETIAGFLKSNLIQDPACQMLVIANERNAPEVVPGMMDLAEVLVITEDSISMISEGLSAGKIVIILTVDSENLPQKHQRFLELVRTCGGVLMARPEDAVDKILDSRKIKRSEFIENETELLKEELKKLL